MNIHEHQAKAVLAEFGVAVPRGFPAFTVDDAVDAANKLGGPVFVEKDMAMLEVNPLIVMKDGHLRVLDAKVSFDGNALFRHEDMKALRDETEEDAKEIEASEWDLAYVALDGNIGCMVNGAGLAITAADDLDDAAQKIVAAVG